MRPLQHPGVTTQASDQFGLLTRRQVLAFGFSERQVDHAVASRHLLRVARGLYAVPGLPDDHRRHLLAAVLAGGPGARLTAEGVLRLLHVPGIATPGRPTILTTHPRRSTHDLARARRDLRPSSDHLDISGIPSTTAARAIVEVAAAIGTARRSDRWLLGLIDRARREVVCTDAEVAACAHRLPTRHAGVRRVRELVTSGELAMESDGERQLDDVLDQLGIAKLFTWQVWVTTRIRVDAAAPLDALRQRMTSSRKRSASAPSSGSTHVADAPAGRVPLLVLEYDGARHHSAARDVANDATRQAAVEALGHRVVRVRSAMIRQPQRLADALTTALVDTAV